MRRAVRNEALTHPATIYPGVLGVLGGLAGALFASPACIVFSLGMLVFGAGSAIVNFYFRDTIIAQRYARKLKEEWAEQERRRVLAIQEDLQSIAGAGVDDLVPQAVAQFQQINEKYGRLQALLEDVPGGPELSGRISFAAEQVYFNVLDNLRSVSAALKGAATIDFDDISHRLEALAAIERPTDADKREAETLKKRLQLRDAHLGKADALLSRNEEAITGIDEMTAVIVSGDKTDDRFAMVNPESSVERLNELARSLSTQEKETMV
ncbi:MAG: hypothetical protein HY913_12995 [Desulfomonile tiedjei]|nr:hypothetical protein [Desulfomonile tiedjei]